ncbi:iron complex transport system substrate-binding protein [Methanococcus voltae]|uniref:Iron complex transport system substrate-binding protein n=1 Tax=Methanococcus voltae TaxID=2188 RepID=A0A8J7USY3_METVO|nr:ABC transporter substrate-binding protein [Methanococcus voltae]MBP2202062.1 iron complex transport system substrate-binding protein [Methanococcus voltae]
MNKTLKKSLVTILSIFAVVTILMSCGCTSEATEPTTASTTDNDNISIKDNNLDKNTEYITVTDMAGRTVQVPKKVDRTIGLGSSLREIVYLQATDKVVGVEKLESDEKVGSRTLYILTHKELMDLPIVSESGNVEQYYERILQINPDVIFIGYESDVADDMQEKLQIPVVVVYTAPVGTENQNEQYTQSLRLMGKILDKEERAEEILNKIEEYKADLALRASKSTNNQTVYLGGRAYQGINGLTATDAKWPPLVYLGANNKANNVAYDLCNESKGMAISKEQLLEWNPECIFISSISIDKVSKEFQKPEFKNLDAVSNNNVYQVLPYRWYLYNKGTAIIDSYYIGKVLYPEQFEDIDPVEKADEVYTFFYGKPAYDDLTGKIGGFKKLELGSENQ